MNIIISYSFIYCYTLLLLLLLLPLHVNRVWWLSKDSTSFHNFWKTWTHAICIVLGGTRFQFTSVSYCILLRPVFSLSKNEFNSFLSPKKVTLTVLLNLYILSWFYLQRPVIPFLVSFVLCTAIHFLCLINFQLTCVSYRLCVFCLLYIVSFCSISFFKLLYWIAFLSLFHTVSSSSSSSFLN